MEKLPAVVEVEKEEQPASRSADVEGWTGALSERGEQQLLLELAILTLEVALRIEALEVRWGRGGARRARSARAGT